MQTTGLRARASMAGLCGVLIAMTVAAGAQTALAQETTGPAKSNSVEVGVGNVGDGSFKAGEYNGLESKGAFAIGNIDLRDSVPYSATDPATRWVVMTRDLGLDTRTASAKVGVQGKYRLLLGFDQLLRNRSDTFQTPFDGTGTNTLTLPAGWLVPTVASSAGNTTSARGLIQSIGTAPYLGSGATQGAVIAPTAAQTNTVNAAIAADLPAFHNVNLSTKRTTYNVGFGYQFNEKWAVDGSIRPEHRNGLKPLGTVSRNTGGDIATIIPDQIDTNTNQFSTSLNFKGTKSFAEVGYYGSFFTNNVSFMSWQNWATAAHTVNTMSSTPNNSFNQFNGSYTVKMSATTKLVANGSYGRGTQNDTFLKDVTTPVVPVNSLNGLMVATLVNAKITNRPTKKLNLSAAYKYNNRDNRTAVNIYQYADAGEAPTANANFPAGPNNPFGAVLAQNANANRPYSRRVNLAQFEADYSLGAGQWIKGGYDFEQIHRECNASWISCADAATTNENTLRVEWRANAGGNMTARVGYAHSSRRGDYNENAFLALVPYANVSSTGATGGATAYSFMTANGWNGWGPALGFAATSGNMNVFFPSNNALAQAQYANGNRISELQGLRRYWVADRDRNKLRSLLIWQGGESISFQGGVDLNKDDYNDTTYGLQDAKGWAANLDATYTPRDNLSTNVFYTYENQSGASSGNTFSTNSSASAIGGGQPGAIFLSGNSPCNSYTTLEQRNNNNKLDPCLNWSSDLSDVANTVGAGVRTKVRNKVDVTGDFIFTRARTDNVVTGGNYANNLLNGAGGPPTTIAAYYIQADAVPTIKSDIAQLRLSGTFPVSGGQSLRVAYAYLHMTSSDWIYESMQTTTGTLTGVLPSNEQPFNYKENVLGFSYILTF